MVYTIYFVGFNKTEALRRGPFMKFTDASDWQMRDGANHNMYAVEVFVSDLKEVMW